MADYGVKAEGFVRPRLPELRLGIIDDIKSRLREHDLPDDIETRPDSVMGILIDTFAEREAAYFEVMEGVYYAMYPGSATDTSLDRSVSFAGVKRLTAEPSRGYVILYGQEGTLVAAGSQIRNRNTNNLWEVVDDTTISQTAMGDTRIEVSTVEDDDYTITIGGSSYTYSASGDTKQQILNGLENALALADQEVTNNGAYLRITSNVDNFSVSLSDNLSVARIGTRTIAQTIENIPEQANIGDLNHIVTLVSGWQAVDNLQVGTVGRRPETDAELRERYSLGVFRLGSSTLPAMEANIYESVIGADAVRVFDNKKDTIENGMLPHSVHVIVSGGLEDDIAEAIYKNKAGGIDTNGAIEINLTTDQGPQKIYFDRPERVYIWVKITLTVLDPDEGEVFPTSGLEEIRKRIAEQTFEIGFDVLPQRFYCTVFETAGIESAVIEVDSSTDINHTPSYSTNPIQIDRDQIAILAEQRVEVLII